MMVQVLKLEEYTYGNFERSVVFCFAEDVFCRGRIGGTPSFRAYKSSRVSDYEIWMDREFGL